VLQLPPADLLAVLPRELVPTVIARLSKFILRAKVKLVDESPSWRITGLVAASANGDAAAGVAGPAAVAHSADAIAVQVAQRPSRWLLLTSTARPPLPEAGAAAPPEIWQRAVIAAGEPQVCAATSEEFVAQMLNLDLLGAIAFDKGCYTGQEVIARAHYRGRVKRRMQRFVTPAPQALKPGDAGTLADGRTFQVVDAVLRADGRCEFLAVAPLSEGESATPVSAATAAERLAAESLSLPYPLPS